MSDINLNGWVQKRRGVLQHLQDGRITANEYLVFDILLMLADKETGSYKTNSGAIAFWTNGQIKKDAADRALRGLEEKGYIVREITPGHNGVYPYHVQKYIATAGADEGKVLTFTKKSNGTEKIAELLGYFGAEGVESTPTPTPTATPTATPTPTPTPSADKTIREKGNGKPEKRQVVEGVVADSEKPPAARLANHFWIKLGKLSRYSNPETVKSWTKLAGSLLGDGAADYDEVKSVIDWALEESAFWTERIVGATTKGPMEYFVEKYEDIKQRMGADRKALENAKNKQAKVSAAVKQVSGKNADKPAYRQVPGDQIVKEGQVEKW